MHALRSAWGVCAKLLLRHEKFNMVIRSIGESLTNIRHMASNPDSIAHRRFHIRAAVLCYQSHLVSNGCKYRHLQLEITYKYTISSWLVPRISSYRFSRHWPNQARTLLSTTTEKTFRLDSSRSMSTTAAVTFGLFYVEDNLYWQQLAELGSSIQLLLHQRICILTTNFVRLYLKALRIKTLLAAFTHHLRMKLTNSTEVARRRFYAMERRMLKSPDLRS